jgi:glycosyltransferase involved in cell wall biosynthesis
MSDPALLAVFSSDALGGSELFNLEFLRAVERRGVAISAIVPGDGPLHQALEPLTRSIETVAIPGELTSMSRFDSRLDAGKTPRRVWALGGYLPKLARALASHPGPVCSFGFRSQLATACVLRPARRSAWVVHEVVPPGVPARVWSLAARRASRVFTYSTAAATQPPLHGRGAEVRAVRFDLSRYAPGTAAKQVRTLGLVGDLVELKGHLLAIDLVERLRARGKDVSLLLVGRDVSRNVPRAGEYAERVRRAVGQAAAVELVSSTPEGMPEAMARIDVLLHLSSVPESFGRVCVEAMAAGRPVVAYDHGGVSELIEDRRTGFLCPVGEPESVLAALTALLDDPLLCTRMGHAAQSDALERFAERPELRDTIGDALADLALEDR